MAIYYGDGTNSSEGRLIKTTIDYRNSRGSTTSTSYVGSGLEISGYAAESSSNKLILTFMAPMSGNYWNVHGFKLRFQRDGSDIGQIGSGASQMNSVSNGSMAAHSSTHTQHYNQINHSALVYEPANTTSSTYRVAFAAMNSGYTVYVVGNGQNYSCGVGYLMIQEFAH